MNGPASATLNVTARCNSKCVYCDYGADKPPVLDDPTTRELLDRIEQLSDLGVRQLTISGGEPWLRHDLVELVAKAHAAGMDVTCITNGTPVSVAKLSALTAAGLTNLVVSCDSFDPDLYHRIRGIPISGVLRVVENFRTARANGEPMPILTVNAVITRLNMHQLVDLVERLSPFLAPTDAFTVQAYTPHSGATWKSDDLMMRPEDVAPLRETLIRMRDRAAQLGIPLGTPTPMLERIVSFMGGGELGPGYTCRTGYHGVFLREDGAVLACWNLPPVGDLSKDSLADIWHSPGYEQVRGRMERLECRRCVLVCHDSDWIASSQREQGS